MKWGRFLIADERNNASASAETGALLFIILVSVNFFCCVNSRLCVPCIIICADLFGIFGSKDCSAYDYLAVGSFLLTSSMVSAIDLSVVVISAESPTSFTPSIFAASTTA